MVHVPVALVTDKQVDAVTAEGLVVGEQLVEVHRVVAVVLVVGTAGGSAVTHVRVVERSVQVVAGIVTGVDGELQAFEEDEVHIGAGVEDVALVEVVIPEGLGHDVTALARTAASLVPFKHHLAEIVIDIGSVGVVLVDRVDRTDVAGEVELVDVTRAAAGVGRVTVGHRTGHVQTGLQPFLGLDVDVHTGVEALHVGTDGVALVVQVTEGEVVVGLLAGAAGGNGVFLAVAQALDGFLPVEVVRIEEFRGAVEGAVGDNLGVSHVERVVVQAAGTHDAGGCGGIGFGGRLVGAGGQEAVTHDLPFHGNILVGVEAFVFGNAADAETVVDTDVEGDLLAAALLGGDEHHAVGGAGTVQGGGSRVLQDGDRLDVIGVDVGDRSVERNAVHHIERGAVGAE